MTFDFQDAKRQDISLLILLAGGTGSGKTESALRLATGLSADQPFAVIDTENGRALHKADDYTFKHAALDEPFTPERYSEAVTAADAAGFPVIVIDSGSHEYDGVGGILDIQTDEFERMGRKETARMSSWIEPKRRHKQFVQTLLRVRAHVILCLRAEDKIEIVKRDGKTVVQPRQSLTGYQGWTPIVEKRLPFEATVNLMLTADAPGVPKPIKLESRHQALVPLDEQLSEATGARLAAWAAGSLTEEEGKSGDASVTTASARRGDQNLAARAERRQFDSAPSSANDLADELVAALRELGADDSIPAVEAHRDDEAWLSRNLERAKQQLAGRADLPLFEIPASARTEP